MKVQTGKMCEQAEKEERLNESTNGIIVQTRGEGRAFE